MKQYIRTYTDIVTIENLLTAWQEFLRGKRTREDMTAFGGSLIDNVLALQQELLNKTYQHGPYYAFNISDPKPRNIHKAMVRDRLLHHLLYSALYPYFDRHFIYDSYSCRVGKGTHKAIKRFDSFTRTVSNNYTKSCWVLKCDIKKFFASIDHSILKSILAQHILDADILWLLGVVIDGFHTPEKPGVGLPLGNLTSQLLVNVYMNEFDQFVKHHLKARYYIRYADDFVFLSYDKVYLQDLIPIVEDFLVQKLKLSLHPDKVFIKTLASGVDFLGWVHFPRHRVLRTATKRRMFANPGVAARDEAVLNSYKGLLSHGNAYRLSRKLESS